MARRRLLGGKLGWCAAGLVAAALAGFYFAGTPLLIWYYLYGLTRADEADRDLWVKRLAPLDREAVPGLVECLRRDDERSCENVAAALTALIDAWPAPDGRRAELAQQLEAAYPRCSPPGQRAALEVAGLFLQGDPPEKAPDLLASLQRLLTAASRTAEPGHRQRALVLAALLLPLTPKDADWEVYRQLARFGVKDADAQNRCHAARLTLHPAVRADRALLQDLVPLVQDPSPAVRRVALLSVGPEEDLINEDDLLPVLHDADDEVRRLCEAALRSRGLKDTHIRLGKLLTDARPQVRLDVLQHLHEADDLQPEVWLTRLSQDRAAAVRAAAIRYAFEASIELGDRLGQMAAGDPDGTVRQNARDLQLLQRLRNRR